MNLFSVFPQGSVNASFLGIVEALFAAGGIATYHAFEGILLIILATLVLALALKTRIRTVNLFAILGFVMVISAVIGGVLFVLSEFQNNGFFFPDGHKLPRCICVLLPRALLHQGELKNTVDNSAAHS